MNLEIVKGGRLVKVQWKFDPSEQEGEYVRIDVTDDVPMFLFEHCTIEEGVTLRDIFLLIQKHIYFFRVVLNNWVEEFVTECLLQETEKDEDLEYLELYWHVENDLDGTYGNTFPCFHGIDGKGQPWSISLSKLCKYAHLPVKLNDILTLVIHRDKVETYENPQFSLGQILHGIVWEISYYGQPSKRDATFDMITERVEHGLEEMDTLD
jgi:hypothetical protein